MSSPVINRCTIDQDGKLTLCRPLQAAMDSCGFDIVSENDRFGLFPSPRISAQMIPLNYCPICGGSLIIPGVPSVPPVPS